MTRKIIKSWNGGNWYAETDEIILNCDYAKGLYLYWQTIPRILDYEVKAKVNKSFPSTGHLITYLQQHPMHDEQTYL